VYREVVNRALHAGVAFYTIDAGGTKTRTEGAVDNRYRPDSLSALQSQGNYEDAIRYLATGTGGHAIINRNRLDDGLELLGDDLITFYSLGFTVEAADRDALHELEVQVPGRPELQVRHRRVVYEKSAGTRVRERLVAGLLVDVSANPLGCRVTTGQPRTTEEGTIQLPLEVSVPVARLTLVPEYGARVGRLKLYLTTEDDEGRRSDIVTEEYEVSVLEEDLEEALAKTYTLGVDLVLRPGPATIAVAVTDEGSGETSFAVLRRAQ
jgi:hypothetical protein